MKTTEVKSDVKSKVNNVGKNAKNSVQDTFDKALDSAPEMISTVTELGKSFLESVNSSREKVMNSAVTSIESLDKSVKTRPWAFIGGAVVLGFAAGFLIGNKRKSLSPLLSDGVSTLKSGVEKIRDQIEQNINKVSDRLQ